MSTLFRCLKDLEGNIVLPVTRAEGVYFQDNTTLDKLSFYPIGSIYMSVGEESPSSLFGGTWEQIQDKFLIGAGNLYSLLSEGGEATHTLTIDEIPAHSHSYKEIDMDASEGNASGLIGSRVGERDSTTGEAGSGSPHNNLPPYIAVNIWKRVE